jgi:hypothetical protein
MFFLNLVKEAYLQQRQPIPTLINLSWRRYSFQKLTQFSKRNNVLDAPASYMNVFLLRNTSVYSTQLKRPIWKKHRLSPLWKTYVAEVFLSKLTQFSQENNVIDPPASNTDGFLWRDICVSSNQLSRPIWNKETLSPPWKTYVAWSIPIKN